MARSLGVWTLMLVLTGATSFSVVASAQDAQPADDQAVPPPEQGGVVVVEHQPDNQQHQQQQQQPPPGYGQQPAGYGQQPAGYQPQPVYQQPVYQPRPRRHRVPYTEGMDMPEGGTITKRVRLGLLIPGAALFVIPYLSTALTYSFLADARASTRQPQPILLVPVLGPFLAIPNLDENFEDMGRDSGTRKFWLTFNGLIQLAGLTMAIVGAIPKKYVEYYAGNFNIMPRFGADGGGLDLTARF